MVPLLTLASLTFPAGLELGYLNGWGGTTQAFEVFASCQLLLQRLRSVLVNRRGSSHCLNLADSSESIRESVTRKGVVAPIRKEHSYPS